MLSGQSLATAMISEQHRSTTNELIYQLIENEYSMLNSVFFGSTKQNHEHGSSSDIYHDDEESSIHFSSSSSSASSLAQSVDICLLSNVTNEMLFIDPKLIQQTTRFQNTEQLTTHLMSQSILSSSSASSGWSTASGVDNTPSIIISPRLKHQRNRWSTHYGLTSHHYNTIPTSSIPRTSLDGMHKQPNESTITNNAQQRQNGLKRNPSNASISSSSSGTSTSSDGAHVIDANAITEDGAINSLPSAPEQGNSSSQKGTISSNSVSQPFKHHHTISSLNKKDFQQFLPRVSLPNYGDISSVYSNLNIETIQEMGCMGGSFTMEPSTQGKRKSFLSSRSFTFGSEKNLNRSIGTTMTFSSMTVSKVSPRNESHRRSGRNSFSFFGKQYMRNEQPNDHRDSVVSELDSIDMRRFTEAEFANDTHYRSSNADDTLQQGRRATVGSMKDNAQTMSTTTAKPSDTNLLAVTNIQTAKNNKLSPSSPLEISSSTPKFKTPEKTNKKKQPMSTKVKEFFSSIGRRKRKSTASYDSDENNPSSHKLSTESATDGNSSPTLSSPSNSPIFIKSPSIQEPSNVTSSQFIPIQGAGEGQLVGTPNTSSTGSLQSSSTLGDASSSFLSAGTSPSSISPHQRHHSHIPQSKGGLSLNLSNVTEDTPSQKKERTIVSPKKSISKRRSSMIPEIDTTTVKYLTHLIVEFKESSIRFARLVDELSMIGSCTTPTGLGSPIGLVDTPKGTKNRRPTSMHYVSASPISAPMSFDLSSPPVLQFAETAAFTPSIFHCLNERSSHFTVIITSEITLCIWYSLPQDVQSDGKCILSEQQLLLLNGGYYDEKLKNITLNMESKLRGAFMSVMNQSSSFRIQKGGLSSSRSMEFSNLHNLHK